MPVLTQNASVLAIAVALATGCAEQMHLLRKGPTGGASPFMYWPPAPSTSVAIDTNDSTREHRSLGEVADRVANALRAAGYTDQHWYPIGAQFVHGFAVTTRLERINVDATPRPTSERWFARFPEASTLRWLRDARRTRLPGRGRYRVFLVAFTDLAIGPSDRAPRWNQESYMDGPDAAAVELPAARRVSPEYRLGVYVYEYESTSSDGDGGLMSTDASLDASTHVKMSGLTGLFEGHGGGRSVP